jgi:hypothetical protein
MALAECRWCGGTADTGSTCPRSIACPTCAAPAGASCKRPSGHRAAELHAARVALAESRPAATAGQLRMEADPQRELGV